MAEELLRIMEGEGFGRTQDADDLRRRLHEAGRLRTAEPSGTGGTRSIVAATFALLRRPTR
jgi:hypothetical protein